MATKEYTLNRCLSGKKQQSIHDQLVVRNDSEESCGLQVDEREKAERLMKYVSQSQRQGRPGEIQV